MPFEIVQTNALAPIDKPVTLLEGLFSAAMVPFPTDVLQMPVPTEGAVANSVNVEAQTV